MAASGAGWRSGCRRALRWLTHLPAPIVALVTLTALAAWLKLPVETIGSRFGELPRGPAAHSTCRRSAGTAREQLFIPTITIAMLGAIESLLCARVADTLSDVSAPRLRTRS